MKIRKQAVGLALSLLCAASFASVTDTRVGTDPQTWVVAQNDVMSLSGAGAGTGASVVTPAKPGFAAHAAAQDSERGLRSNLRLILIGAILMGVVALRRWKKSS